ncbi:hypothetical protein LguiA_011625 [Lonicera macranthoides]
MDYLTKRPPKHELQLRHHRRNRHPSQHVLLLQTRHLEIEPPPPPTSPPPSPIPTPRATLIGNPSAQPTVKSSYPTSYSSTASALVTSASSSSLNSNSPHQTTLYSPQI